MCSFECPIEHRTCSNLFFLLSEKFSSPNYKSGGHFLLILQCIWDSIFRKSEKIRVFRVTMILWIFEQSNMFDVRSNTRTTNTSNICFFSNERTKWILSNELFVFLCSTTASSNSYLSPFSIKCSSLKIKKNLCKMFLRCKNVISILQFHNFVAIYRVWM